MKSLFKYRPLNHNAIQSLIHQTLHFHRLKNYKDPYDIAVSLKELPTQVSQEILANYALCSFSATFQNAFLWSLYANAHKGICIEYATEEIANAEGNPKGALKFCPGEGSNKEASCLNFSAVNYSNENKADWDLGVFEPLKPELVTKIVCRKGDSWAFEEEWRGVVLNDAIDQSGLLPLNNNVVRSVTFGMRTPLEDKILMYEMSNSIDSLSRIQFYQAIPATGSFSLERREFDPKVDLTISKR